MEIKDLFVPYEQALELKELGFDEPCFSAYRNIDGEKLLMGLDKWYNLGKENTHIGYCAAPTFSQAFKFFREKYNLYGCPKPTFSSLNPKQIVFFYYWIKDGEEFTKIKEYNTYEEAELECLKKLIQIVKDGKTK